jgi:hypothetical protein
VAPTRTERRGHWDDNTRLSLLEDDVDNLEAKVLRRLNITLSFLVTLNVAAIAAIAGWVR